MSWGASLCIDLSYESDQLYSTEAVLFEGSGLEDGRVFYTLEEKEGKPATGKDREMMVRVRLFGYLKDSCKEISKREEEFGLTIPEDSTVRDLLRLLGVLEKELMLVINPGKKEKVLTIDDAYQTWKEVILEPEDTIWIYPFLDGG
jgi:hypothetical protein